MADRPPTFNELLILEVQKNPELYDQQHRVCTDSEERIQMWESIARRIDGNVTAGFAKKRWLQLRDRYRKELKTSLRNMIPPKWPYFSKLSWLDSYLKDSKSSGLFLPNALDTHSAPIESFIKEEGNESSDFQYSNPFSANALLENIMAASSSAFEQLQRQRENGKFSPDFAETQSNVQLNSSASTSGGSEIGSSNSSDVESKQQDSSSSSDRRSSSQSDTSCETDNQQNELISQQGPNEFTQSIFGNTTDNFSFILRNLTQQHQQKMGKQRNPPYLVRRGGGIKVKPDSNNVLSAFKPLAKTMSVGGLIPQLNSPGRTSLQLTQSVGLASETKTGLEEWKGQEWSNDEDMLFARLIVLRLRKFSLKENRKIKASIFNLLNDEEEQIDIN